MTVATTKGSWFNDTTTASGKSAASTVGIAVGSPSVSGGLNLGPGIGGLATLNGWFLVKDPGGALHIFQQIDTGPAGFTGRGIDYSQPSLSHLKGGDPTDQTSQLVYLGKTAGDIAANINTALSQLGMGATNDPSALARAATTQGFVDISPSGIQKALGAAASGGAVQSAAQSAASAVSGAANAASSVASGVGNIAGLLTSTDFWIRLGEAIAGVILIAMGLRSLTGVTGPSVSTVAKAIR